MFAETVLKRIRRNLNKSYSIQARFLVTIIVAMLAIAVFIGGISIYEVDRYIQGQAENFVKVTCENEGAQINDSFGDMEKSVKIMESYVMDFFESKADTQDRAVQEKVVRSADQMFVDVAKHTNGAVAYYLRFAPEISSGKSGLFYSKQSGSDEYIFFEPTDITLYDKHDTEHVGWYWQPYEAGQPVWMKPYHNQNNDILMISYVVPMYYEGEFIGIVGMDFDYMVLADWVHEIEIYENGFAHLEMDGVALHSIVHENEEKLETDDKEYLRVSKKLVNGMTLVLSASYDDIWQIRYQIAFKILLAVLILSVLFTLVVIVIVKKIVDPLKKITEASVKLSNGDYNVETVQSNTQEIKLLSTAFENMTTHLREREKLLRLFANRDSLTGLRNTNSYKTWVTEFDEEIENEEKEFGVAVFDVNCLKETNDRYGHDTGNELIINAAKVISDVFKRSPVFRIGGDEFVAILQNGDLEEREKLFVQFDMKCANMFIKDKSCAPLSVARGFAKFDAKKDVHFADVFKRADDAMYENKRKMKKAVG